MNNLEISTGSGIAITFSCEISTEEKATKETEIHVLFVDDEEHNLRSFKASLRRDFKVITAISGDEVLNSLKTSTHKLSLPIKECLK